MKFCLTILVLTSIVLSVAMENKEAVGERIAGNIFKLRTSQVAHASTQSLGTITANSNALEAHIAHLMQQHENRCDPALRLLRAASTTYDNNTYRRHVQDSIKNSLNKQLDGMCDYLN